jgi:crotonobetainyl-CoA:carnitine CoA-transferase CaiB-like acyl-CoA transferase
MIESAPPPSGSTPITLPALLPLMGSTPGVTRWAGPELGEHTEEVLCGELGYSQQQLAALREAGVV